MDKATVNGQFSVMLFKSLTQPYPYPPLDIKPVVLITVSDANICSILTWFSFKNYTVEQKRAVFFKFVDIVHDENFPQDLTAKVI